MVWGSGCSCEGLGLAFWCLSCSMCWAACSCTADLYSSLGRLQDDGSGQGEEMSLGALLGLGFREWGSLSEEKAQIESPKRS